MSENNTVTPNEPSEFTGLSQEARDFYRDFVDRLKSRGHEHADEFEHFIFGGVVAVNIGADNGDSNKS